MDLQTIKLYTLKASIPCFALFAIINGINGIQNSSAANSAGDRTKILEAAMPFTLEAQKPQVQSNLRLAKKAAKYHKEQANQNVAWLFLNLGLLALSLYLLQECHKQEYPSAPGND
jgi:hypothetical protein